MNIIEPQKTEGKVALSDVAVPTGTQVPDWVTPFLGQITWITGASPPSRVHVLVVARPYPLHLFGVGDSTVNFIVDGHQAGQTGIHTPSWVNCGGLPRQSRHVLETSGTGVALWAAIPAQLMKEEIWRTSGIPRLPILKQLNPAVESGPSPVLKPVAAPAAATPEAAETVELESFKLI